MKAFTRRSKEAIMYKENVVFSTEFGTRSIKKLIPELAFWITVLAFITFYLYRSDVSYENGEFSVLVTNYVIIYLSIVFMVFGDPYPFSLNKIFMLFSLFFFGIAPALQYQQGVTFWGATPFTSADYFRTNIIILFILVFYQATYSLSSKVKVGSCIYKFFYKFFSSRGEMSELPLFALLLIALVSAFITLLVMDFNLTKLLFRSISGTDLARSVGLVYGTFVRPLPAIVLVLIKQSGKRNRLFELILWIILLLTNFPTGTARYYAAAIYLPLLSVYFKKWFFKKYLLLNKTLIVGLLIIFPFLDQFRHIHSLSNINLFVDLGMFSQGHFDSYQMFMKVVSEEFVTMGRQLLGVIFFFIPRSIWASKPVGSGHLVAERFGYTLSNISMNFFGEGYINFGFWGIVLFVILLASINCKLDKAFWRNNQGNIALSTFYFLFLGMEVFILRGDLMSSFAYTCGMTLSLVFVLNMGYLARRFRRFVARTL